MLAAVIGTLAQRAESAFGAWLLGLNVTFCDQFSSRSRANVSWVSAPTPP
jgi:hypothetical protein